MAKLVSPPLVGLIMILRFEWQFLRPGTITPDRPPATQAGRRLGVLLGGAMTVLLIGWVIWRWYIQPAWLAQLPLPVQEGLGLLEAASGFTIAFLWIGLTWRWRKAAPAAPVAALTSAQLYALSPKAFERYVARLFSRKGYQVTHRGRSGDHGVDLELIGPDGRRAVVQCKRYLSTVGEEMVRELYGTLLHEQGAHAFLVTTADISAAAQQWAEGKPITLVDGRALARIGNAIAASEPPPA
jgi:restriction system protein